MKLVPLFGGLLAAQAAHSAEEYAGALFESFPPARYASGLVSDDPARGFLIANITIVSLGLLCLFGPIRGRWASARPIAWAWAAVELVNGTVHPLWSLWQWAYTPGVATAPLLVVLALALARELRRGIGRK